MQNSDNKNIKRKLMEFFMIISMTDDNKGIQKNQEMLYN